MRRNVLFIAFWLGLIMLAFPAAALALPDGVPAALEAPQYQKMELRQNDEGVPYYYIEYSIPQSILDLDQTRPEDNIVGIDVQRKIDNGEWEDYSGGHLDAYTTTSVSGKTNVFSSEIEVLDEGSLEEIQINNHTYSFRLRFWYQYSYGDGPGEWDYVYSAWSNELANQSGSFYKGASAWAIAELDKAQGYGLITERIKDNMSGKITREEFAEVAVKLYETYTGKIGTVGTASFIDTTNPEILKAANLGLVTGVGNNKYAPNELVTREQMATILLRALKVINPGADFSNAGAAPFADDAKIKAWARDGVYYCSKASIVNGVGGNMFDPEGNATREAAVIVCTRAYEYYK
ncbi:MAG TPA: S-layer homology domain-containing protein [Syntrophomonas sp.]|nr:S-layer homology domain-containing protein [Syntrophomonas sp.]HRW13090.1 S-layer homology domain-containing protein [Syntrophomonas sp.]